MNLKRTSFVVLTCAIGLSLAACSNSDVYSNINVDKKDNISYQYDIYPKVQNANYETTTGFKMGREVNVIVDDEVDQVTKDRLELILNENGIDRINYSDSINEGMTNIVLAVEGGKTKADTIVKDKITLTDAKLYEKIDAYTLAVDNGIIILNGNSVDSAFYSLATLDIMLNDASKNKGYLRNVYIEDYAETVNRGYIEGYYGIPWTTEDRIDLLEFGSKYKMNTYMFAPKDDPYHSSHWRELYPEDELAKMKEVVDAATANNIEFTWSIHPFLHERFRSPGHQELGKPLETEEDYQADLEQMIAKFEQLYSIGVRSFAVGADDFSAPPKEPGNKGSSWSPEFHGRIMTDLVEWGNTLPEPVEWTFVPVVYTSMYLGWGSSYVEGISDTIPDEVEIQWTGEQVVGQLSQKGIDDFVEATKTEKHPEGRKPYFWLNWPTNDYASDKLLMGEATVIEEGVEGLSSIVANPMQQSAASEVALFQIADFAWNTDSFDSEVSYVKSFKFIDETGAEYLEVLAKHLTYPGSSSMVVEESEDFKPLIDQYMADLEADKFDTDNIDTLKKMYREIEYAIDMYMLTASNDKLVAQITPWLYALKDVCQSTYQSLSTTNMLTRTFNTNLNGEDLEKEKVAYQNHLANMKAELEIAKKLRDSSNSHTITNLNGVDTALAGAKYLNPFMNDIITKLEQEIAAYEAHYNGLFGLN